MVWHEGLEPSGMLSLTGTDARTMLRKGVEMCDPHAASGPRCDG